VTRCPICGVALPSRLVCCPCGYTPEAVDELVVKLRLRRWRGIAKLVLILGMLGALIPLGWVFAAVTSWILVSLVWTAIGVGLAVTALRSAHQLFVTLRHERAARELAKLPAARVVARDRA
jgi:hypothetical protein